MIILFVIFVVCVIASLHSARPTSPPLPHHPRQHLVIRETIIPTPHGDAIQREVFVSTDEPGTYAGSPWQIPGSR